MLYKLEINTKKIYKGKTFYLTIPGGYFNTQLVNVQKIILKLNN